MSATAKENSGRRISHLKRELKEKYLKYESPLRIICFLVFIAIAISVFVAWQFKILTEETFDLGGIASLLVLIGLIFLLRLDNEVKETLDRQYNSISYRMVILLFLIAGIIALWFSIRTFGLVIEHSLIIPSNTFTSPSNTTELVPSSTPELTANISFSYTASNIFSMLGFLLAANLCFSLGKTFRDIDGANGKTKNPSTRDANKPDDSANIHDPVPKLLGAVIQTIIIGLITFTPRLLDSTLLDLLGNNNSSIGAIIYAIILVILISSLISLIRFRNREFPLEKNISANS